MDGYILLSDGMRLDGKLAGASKTAVGWLAANTAVVGFQEMLTDPAYAGRMLVFTYPEIGNVGTNKAFDESPRVQAAGVVVKVLSEYRSHYLSEDSLENLLKRDGVPCLTDVDTRGLAVHIRGKGEMAAAIAPADADPKALREKLAEAARPQFKPPMALPQPKGASGPVVAVLDLGLRRSQLAQLASCCRPVLVSYDADAKAVLATKAAGLFISDGPGAAEPPKSVVKTIAALLGKVPMLGCGLGHVALGMALGCKVTSLKRGHHGANYPVRNLAEDTVEVTQQRHTVLLERKSVEDAKEAELLCENLNDSSVEGVRARDGGAVGFQFILAPPSPGEVNRHIRSFVDGLAGK